MNFRNKHLVTAVRVILGLIFLGSGIAGLMSGSSTQGVPPSLIPIMQALWVSGLFVMIKLTEALAGLMLVIGFLPALAAIFVAPICVGVIVFNANTMPPFVIAGIVISILDIYLGYAYWNKYAPLFSRN